MQQGSLPVFPRERAFVVQLHGDADQATGRWEGRVEHVSSGRFAYFKQLHELEAFFRQALDPSTRMPPSDQNDEADRGF